MGAPLTEIIMWDLSYPTECPSLINACSPIGTASSVQSRKVVSLANLP